MAADLHIHVVEGITEEDVKIFQSNVLGSRWFEYVPYEEYNKNWERLYESVGHTPNIWVGSVSWLKAALFDDSVNYIPDAVGKVSEIIGDDFPVIDDNFISDIQAALDLESHANPYYTTSQDGSVIDFLKRHKGKKVFTVSW